MEKNCSSRYVFSYIACSLTLLLLWYFLLFPSFLSFFNGGASLCHRTQNPLLRPCWARAFSLGSRQPRHPACRGQGSDSWSRLPCRRQQAPCGMTAAHSITFPVVAHSTAQQAHLPSPPPSPPPPPVSLPPNKTDALRECASCLLTSSHNWDYSGIIRLIPPCCFVFVFFSFLSFSSFKRGFNCFQRGGGGGGGREILIFYHRNLFSWRFFSPPPRSVMEGFSLRTVRM